MMKRLTRAWALLAGATILSGQALAAEPVPSADLILKNASVYLVEPTGRWAQAVAIKDGKIVAVGSDPEVVRLKGPETKVIDLQKRMVMPGIIDDHLHLAAAANELQTYTCNFSAYGDFDVVIESVRRCAADKKPGEWIVGQAWGSALYGRLASEDAIKRLDEASGGHPVILRNDSIHDRWVNSRALEIAGITRDTPNPTNGQIGRDPKTGALNGLLLESAGALVEAHVPVMNVKPSVEEKAATLAVAVRFLNSLGVTAFNDAAVGSGDGLMSDIRAYRQLDKSGGLSARASLSMLIDPEKPDYDRIYADRATTHSSQLDMGFAKIFVDGVMVSHTAEFLEPYLPTEQHGANFHGTTKMTPERLTEMVKELDRRGVSIKMHTAGDGSVRMALDAIEAARKANGQGGPIHTLAHAGYIASSDIGRVRDLNAAIDASPTVWYPGPILTGTEAVLGKDRARRFWPFKTFVKQGVLVAGGTDWKTLPGEFSNLWDGMQGMVTRKNPTGTAPGALWPEEAVDVGTMIRFFTLNSAKATGAEKVSGSITVGKVADMIVLDQNLFKIPAEKIAATKVDLTIFGGKVVYTRQ